MLTITTLLIACHQVKTSFAEEVVEGYSVNLNCSHPGAFCATITCPPFPLWSQVGLKIESYFIFDQLGTIPTLKSGSPITIIIIDAHHQSVLLIRRSLPPSM